MLGFIVGAVGGSVQFWLLARFVKSIVSGKLDAMAVIPGVFQFFIPLIVLFCVALVHPGSLLWAGCGLASSLIGFAVVKFVLNLRDSKRR